MNTPPKTTIAQDLSGGKKSNGAKSAPARFAGQFHGGQFGGETGESDRRCRKETAGKLTTHRPVPPTPGGNPPANPPNGQSGNPIETVPPNNTPDNPPAKHRESYPATDPRKQSQRLRASPTSWWRILAENPLRRRRRPPKSGSRFPANPPARKPKRECAQFTAKKSRRAKRNIKGARCRIRSGRRP